jgi:hypothetical protein
MNFPLATTRASFSLLGQCFRNFDAGKDMNSVVVGEEVVSWWPWWAFFLSIQLACYSEYAVIIMHDHHHSSSSGSRAPPTRPALKARFNNKSYAIAFSMHIYA